MVSPETFLKALQNSLPTPDPIKKLTTLFADGSNLCPADIDRLKLELDDFFTAQLKHWFNKTYDNYADEHVVHQLLEQFPARKDFPNWARFQIIGLRASLSRILGQLSEALNKQGLTTFSAAQELLNDYAYESIDLLEHGEFYIKQREIHYQLGKPKVRRSVEVWTASIDFFCHSRSAASIGSAAYQPTAIFLIRQAIELRLKNVFGIEYIIATNGAPEKLDVGFFIELAKSCEKDVTWPVDLKLVSKICSWSNAYIHGGVEPYVWQIEWVHHLLHPLFDSGELNGAWRIDGSVKIPKHIIDSVQSRVEAIIRPTRQVEIIKKTPECFVI